MQLTFFKKANIAALSTFLIRPTMLSHKKTQELSKLRRRFGATAHQRGPNNPEVLTAVAAVTALMLNVARVVRDDDGVDDEDK